MLRQLFLHPVRYLLLGWNWKSALVSVALRATTFLVTNLHAGHRRAASAALVEAAFAIVASGILAAATQQLRYARPAAATGLVICIAFPSCLVLAQAAVHHLAGTPSVKVGLLASFCFASLASGVTWSLQRHGFLLTGRRSLHTCAGT